MHKSGILNPLGFQLNHQLKSADQDTSESILDHTSVAPLLIKSRETQCRAQLSHADRLRGAVVPAEKCARRLRQSWQTGDDIGGGHFRLVKSGI